MRVKYIIGKWYGKIIVFLRFLSLFFIVLIEIKLIKRTLREAQDISFSLLIYLIKHKRL
jgi:hypothetical protein